MIGKVVGKEVSQDQFIGKSVLMLYDNSGFETDFFIISYDEKPDLFCLALSSDGLIINFNDEDYPEDCVTFVCELSERAYYKRKKEDPTTYQLFDVMNHHIEGQPIKPVTFDYISKVGFVP
jgi:hypothetical protein